MNCNFYPNILSRTNNNGLFSNIILVNLQHGWKLLEVDALLKPFETFRTFWSRDRWSHNRTVTYTNIVVSTSKLQPLEDIRLDQVSHLASPTLTFSSFRQLTYDMLQSDGVFWTFTGQAYTMIWITFGAFLSVLTPWLVGQSGTCAKLISRVNIRCSSRPQSTHQPFLWRLLSNVSFYYYYYWGLLCLFVCFFVHRKQKITSSKMQLLYQKYIRQMSKHFT